MTQEKFVLDELKNNGEISRNLCLRNYISRLGAIICDLNKKGYVIKGDYRKTENGKDFIYKLIKSPEAKQEHLFPLRQIKY